MNDSKVKIEKKNLVIKYCVIGIGVLIFCSVGFLFAKGYFSKKTRLANNISELGANFYTDYYYDKISNKKSKDEVTKFLKRFENTGITVSLYNIDKYTGDKNKAYIKKLTDAKCDKYKSVATIYPKSPYSKKDFTIKATIDCEGLK